MHLMDASHDRHSQHSLVFSSSSNLPSSTSDEYNRLRASMLCTVLRAQQGDVRPLPYTASPLKLLWSDIYLFFQSAWALPWIFLPLNLGRTWPLDEFYPSWRDFGDATIHAFLVVYQLLFLLSLPIVIIFLVPTLWVLAYIAAALFLNHAICKITLSGFKRFLVSRVPVAERPGHEREHWIYVNGVAVG
jgi:hypothetical protein